MFCGKCRFSNTDENRFCESCGSPLEIALTPVVSATPAQFAQPVVAMQQPVQSGGASILAPKKMSFDESIKYCLTNYANFKGRAARSQWWYFYLFVTLVSFVASRVVPDLYIIATLAFFIPSLSALTRRLHDTGRAGSAAWFLLIPCVGVFLVLIWLSTEGEKTPNKFGPPW